VQADLAVGLIRSSAYFGLGQALHTVMDFTSPQHRGWQPWDPHLSDLWHTQSQPWQHGNHSPEDLEHLTSGLVKNWDAPSIGLSTRNVWRLRFPLWPESTQNTEHDSMKMKCAILLGAGLLILGSAFATENSWLDVKSDGRTSLPFAMPGVEGIVEISVRRVDRSSSNSDAASILRKDCVDQQAPCSVVDDLRIVAGKDALFVPRSAFRGLSNVRSGYVAPDRNGFRLVLKGGDGAEGYLASILFDRNRVTARSLASTLDPRRNLEETRYIKQRESFDR
jgi:hypothetical protein